MKKPPWVSSVNANVLRERRLRLNQNQPSASSSAARIVIETATSIGRGCSNRSLVSSRSSITAAASVCTVPGEVDLVAVERSGLLARRPGRAAWPRRAGSVAVTSVSWIRPGRRVRVTGQPARAVVRRELHRRPAAPGARCASSWLMPTSRTQPSAARTCATSSATFARASSRPSRSGSAPASMIASPQGCSPAWRRSNCGLPVADRAVGPRQGDRSARPEAADPVAALGRGGRAVRRCGARPGGRRTSASPATLPSATAGSSPHGWSGTLPQARVPALMRQPAVDRTGVRAGGLHGDRADVRLVRPERSAPATPARRTRSAPVRR